MAKETAARRGRRGALKKRNRLWLSFLLDLPFSFEKIKLGKRNGSAARSPRGIKITKSSMAVVSFGSAVFFRKDKAWQKKRQRGAIAAGHKITESSMAVVSFGPTFSFRKEKVG